MSCQTFSFNTIGWFHFDLFVYFFAYPTDNIAHRTPLLCRCSIGWALQWKCCARWVQVQETKYHPHLVLMHLHSLYSAEFPSKTWSFWASGEETAKRQDKRWQEEKKKQGMFEEFTYDVDSISRGSWRTRWSGRARGSWGALKGNTNLVFLIRRNHVI